MDDNKQPDLNSFGTFLAEGEILAKQGEFRKAIDAFTKALELKPTDKIALVSRSKCYLQLGDANAALSDAELSLKEDKEYSKGLYQKAEALYAKGDFEYAPVFYHRGNKLRPELDEFRLGIQKAKETIDNSIGNPQSCKLETPPGWTGVKTQDALKAVDTKKPMKLSATVKPAAATQHTTIVKPATTTNATPDRTVKALLGELY
eukprot:Colp12_sorted_trinity150504_noHs@22891